jgi:hypothetical protein
MSTAPMAINQVMMPKIAPIVPYVLLSEMIDPLRHMRARGQRPAAMNGETTEY